MSKRQPIYATVAALGVLGGFYYAGRSDPTIPKTAPRLPKTPGVQNIEDAYSAAGGSKDHLPGQASPRGNSELVQGRSEGTSGMASESFKQSLKDQQQSHENKPARRIEKAVEALVRVYTRRIVTLKVREGLVAS